MGHYTIELNSLLKANYNLGLTAYPIFDEGYRNILNSKIKEHFRWREIGFETPELFKFYLNRTMNEIMPLYNQYYESAKLDFNPLNNFDYEETFSKENTANTTTDTTNDTEGHSESTSSLDGGGTSIIDSTDIKTNKKMTQPQRCFPIHPKEV